MSCNSDWIIGGPATGQNDQGAPGSQQLPGQGTEIVDPSLFFTPLVMLGTGDMIKMLSGKNLDDDSSRRT